MTPEEIEDALELAYESLKQDLPHWGDDKAAEYQNVHRWEWLTVCSEIRGPDVVERGDGYLVYDGDRQLVPRFGSGPGYDRHSIYDDEKGELLIAKAEDGDQVAHNVLCSIAAAFVGASCTMPTRLRDYIAEALRSQSKEVPQRRRGNDPYADHSRNFYVACAILHVVKLGFRPTRNRATEGESACSIVAQALTKFGINLSEPAVEKIWAKFARVFNEELRNSS